MNTNICVVCGAEIPEGMQVCKKCMEKGVIEEKHPCEGCKREEVSSCWKHCPRYKRWFCKVWQIVIGRLKREE